ncbi:MAG: riboflavin biosynthesis protein RibF [Lachnospiraceae bacterium]|nr:riboflavin biosynthesis protein RibF [Lachnospiraceae bacterium]
MDVIHNTTDFRLERTAVTLGKFDGLHRGHQLLLNELAAQKQKEYQTVMFTFHCNPRNLFSDRELSFINTEEENRYYLKHGRIPVPAPDVLIEYPFTKETAAMSPEDFIARILVEKLNVGVIIVGTDCRFGKNRRGDVELLARCQEQYGYTLIVKDKLTWNGSEISSTRIRSQLALGRMEEGKELLGYPYTIYGSVEHGRNMGHRLLLPTLNLCPPPTKLLPPNGVYYSVTTIDGKEYPGITNIGYKPTVGGETKRGAETYLFEFDRDIYGKTVEVSLLHFKRPERKFDSFDDLRVQIQTDAEAGRRYFAEQGAIDSFCSVT